MQVNAITRTSDYLGGSGLAKLIKYKLIKNGATHIPSVNGTLFPSHGDVVRSLAMANARMLAMATVADYRTRGILARAVPEKG